MMNKLLATLSILGTSSILYAQTSAPLVPPHHQFEAGVAYEAGYWKDEAFSPLNYRTRGSVYRISYWRENEAEKALFQANINFRVGQIVPTRTDLDRLTSDYIAGNLSVCYLRLLPERYEKLRLLIGPQYRLNVSYFDYQAQDSFSFIASHTLDAKVLLRYALGTRHEISTGVSLALAGLLVRPPYAGYNTQLLNNYENRPLRLIIDGGRFASLHNYQLISWSVHHQFALTARLGVALQYTLDYQHAPDKFHSFTQLTNQFGGGIVFIL